jgi:hypothetical protein
MKKKRNKGGRPEKIDKDVLTKLEDAFTNAFSDEQACAYAGISTTTLFRYETKRPQFRSRKAMLKKRPDIKAKQTVVSNLGNPSDAWRWLERRDPEFKPTSKLEHAGSIEVADLTVNMSPEEKTALAALSAARRKRIEAESAKLP